MFLELLSPHLNFHLLTFSKPARYCSSNRVEGNYRYSEYLSAPVLNDFYLSKCWWRLRAVRSPVCPAGSALRWRRSTPSLPGPSPSSSASSSPPSPSVPATSPRQRSSCPSSPPWYQNTHVHTVSMHSPHTQQGHGVTAGGGGVRFILLIFCTSCRCLTLNGDTVRMCKN